MATLLLDVLIVLALILNSGAVFFYTLNAIPTLGVLILLSLILLFLSKYISKKNLMIFLIILAIFILNILFNHRFITSRNLLDYVAMTSINFCLMIIASNLSKETFSKFYVRTLAAISVISLICFTIARKFSEIAPYLYSVVHKHNATFLVSPFYTWGWSNLLNRNAGVFWEPGAFEGFLAIALLFLINQGIKTKEDIFYAVLFVITIITTYSTTGYIIMCLIFIAYLVIFLRGRINFNRFSFKDFKKLKKSQYALLALGVVIFLSVIAYFITSPVITHKLTSKSASFLIRSKDISMSISIIFSRPLSGYGIETSELLRQEAIHGVINNSSGLLLFGYTFGVPILIIYILRYCFGLKRMFNEINIVILILIFGILLMTEGLTYYPIYLCFLYYWGNEKMKGD